MKSLFEEYGKTALTVLCALVFLTIIGTVGVIKPWEKPPKVVDKIAFEVTNGQATYNGRPQTGNAIVKVTNPTTNYSVIYEETMSERQTAFTNAGTYVVKFRVEVKGFETVRGSYTLTIDKAVPSYTYPTLATGLKYNATEQRLIKASPSGISNLYSIGNDKNYSAKVPTGLNAGKYKVYWKAEETANYLSYEAYLGEAIIDKGEWNVKINKTNNDIRYTAGRETTLNFPNTYSLDTNKAINKGGKLEYKLNSATLWSTNIPTAKEIGNYLVNVRISGDSNHNEFTSSYTAILKGGDYTLSFDAKGGSGLSNKSVTFGSNKSTSVGTSSRTGYIFQGWYTSSGEPVFDSNGQAIQYKKHDTYWKGGSSYSSSWMDGSYTDWNNMVWNYADDLKLYAHWSAKTYEVVYKPNGGTGSMNSDTATFGQEYITKENAFSNNGYYFAGWNESPSGNGTSWTSWIGRPWVWSYDRGVTLYAQWSPNTYYVTYDANGGSNAPNKQAFKFNSGDKISSSIPTRAGYDFVDWTYGNNHFNPGDKIPSGWGSFTLTANWKIKILYGYQDAATYSSNYQWGAPTYYRTGTVNYWSNYNYKTSSYSCNCRTVCTGPRVAGNPTCPGDNCDWRENAGGCWWHRDTGRSCDTCWNTTNANCGWTTAGSIESAGCATGNGLNNRGTHQTATVYYPVTSWGSVQSCGTSQCASKSATRRLMRSDNNGASWYEY